MAGEDGRDYRTWPDACRSAAKRCDNAMLQNSTGRKPGAQPGCLAHPTLRRHTRLTRMRRGAPMVFRQRNSQRFFKMDMSAADVKRAASAQTQPQAQHPSAEPNGSEILVRCLQAEGVK